MSKNEEKPTKLGQTRADIEFSRDKDALRELDKVEKAHGIKTGVRFRDEGGPILVTVAFYPKVKFYQHDLDLETSGVTSDARPIDREEFERTRSIFG